MSLSPDTTLFTANQLFLTSYYALSTLLGPPSSVAAVHGRTLARPSSSLKETLCLVPTTTLLLCAHAVAANC
eukprot:COSAG05_NODE_9180_length_642_cov_0.920810_2_plen_71_part_01